MPRIDPIQLLNCLSILLSPNGGIKSRSEVQRLAALMTKFSKKLVSKCIYIQILKCTETELLGLFMGSGGWRLAHMWLTESIAANNWPLVRELLELLLLCPVDIDRLKTNNCPKLVKELSKDGNQFVIRALASKLVEQWLKTVKGEIVTPVLISEIPNIINDSFPAQSSNANTCEDSTSALVSDLNRASVFTEIKQENMSDGDSDSHTYLDSKISIKPESVTENESLPILKITLKDGKQVVVKAEEHEVKNDDKHNYLDKDKSNKNKSKNKDKHENDKLSSSNSKSSSKQSSKSHSSKSSDKHKHDSSSVSKSSGSPSRHDNKDKSKDKYKLSKSTSKHDEKHKKSSEKSTSSSSKLKDDKNFKTYKDEVNKEKSKDNKSSKNKESKDIKAKDDKDERHKEDRAHRNKYNMKDQIVKDKELLDKLQSNPIYKLGKIPKINELKKEGPSISIEVRKPDDPKPKTVKTFNSKFRRHGLEEEVKPPPSRASLLKKPAPLIIPPIMSVPKRPSPTRTEAPPEKKAKIIEPVDKPGAIKLIAPKPKPMLLESDMFMSALNASATNKKEPKKRKRRTSGSKDGNANNESSPPHTPTPSVLSSGESKSTPFKFYQDTLDSEEDKEKIVEESTEETDLKNAIQEDIDKVNNAETDIKKEPVVVGGLKGVLCYHKKKGPKKSIKWKPDSELEEIQYFELDETERVNVTKTFTDMKHLERVHEREAFEKARNIINDDVMEEKINWRTLILVDSEGQIPVEYGKGSKERDIQAARQKGTLQPLYFHKAMIPDSPTEPEPETYIASEPTIIPLEDITGNQDNVSDFRNMPWPEPKGNMPTSSPSNINMPHMFQPPISQFPGGFPNPPFPLPGFQAPGMMPPEWQNGIPPHVMGPPGPMGPAPLVSMPPPGSNVSGQMLPPDNMMMVPDMFGGPNPMFMSPDNFNMMDSMNGPQNMYPPDFNMPPGPQTMPGAEILPPQIGFRGGMRGRGSANHWRNQGNPSHWDGPVRGRGLSRGARKTMCIYFQRKGSCRQGDNCSFLHPGVNCPF